jgi:hypothetical protein
MQGGPRGGGSFGNGLLYGRSQVQSQVEQTTGVSYHAALPTLLEGQRCEMEGKCYDVDPASHTHLDPFLLDFGCMTLARALEVLLDKAT